VRIHLIFAVWPRHAFHGVRSRPRTTGTYRDLYLAPATSAILHDDGLTPRLKSQVVHVPGFPGRNQLPSLERRGELSVALYRQNYPAPLFFAVQLSNFGSQAPPRSGALLFSPSPWQSAR